MIGKSLVDKMTEKPTNQIERKSKFSYKNLLDSMYTPTHPASLAVCRILFGLLMLADIPEERGGSIIHLRWGNPKTCYFPLFPQLKRLTLSWMCLLYGVMWLGAMGITLGYKFKLSCLSFILPYWYLLLLDKSYWNNHSYLYGLVSILLLVSSANDHWSVDARGNKLKHVPYWNYFILKFQFFILYFFAGLKKTDMEWLEGYSMTNLGSHWVFDPFKLILTVEQVDYLIVHWSGFILDLTVGFFLIFDKSRPIAMVFCSMFHIMNTRLFSIGMFPYVCLATMPLYCSPDWPIKLIKALGVTKFDNKDPATHNKIKFSIKHHLTMGLLALYCALQIFLPYSHFITKGYNNWTNGLYGYSWDMMVHSWDTRLVVVKVVDNNTGKEHFLDPSAWVKNDRWNKHADMCVQYAHCLKKNLISELADSHMSPNTEPLIDEYITSENISIYVDVWCSMNRRFQQRMYNPNYDLLKARWSPFEPVEWLLPLLTEYNSLRETMKEIETHVYSWSNRSDVLFVADFPGLQLENYISPDLTNVTLTVIDGEIYYESESLQVGYKIQKGSSLPIDTGVFHQITTISTVPSSFMYTYTNSTMETTNENKPKSRSLHSPFPLFEDSEERIASFSRMFGLIGLAVLDIVYNVPMDGAE